LKSKPETSEYPSKFAHWVDIAISIAQNGINKMLGNHVHIGFIAALRDMLLLTVILFSGFCLSQILQWL
jgi:hypothetical protein